MQPPCHFPPVYLCDFVIHYRNTAYHVHKFVLCYHSSYFRTYIEALHKRERSYQTDACSDHPDIPHCIRLPDSCGKVEATNDDFRLFLCHLYFAEEYSCIPYKVECDIDLSAQPPPDVALTCSPLEDYEDVDQRTTSAVDDFTRPTCTSRLCRCVTPSTAVMSGTGLNITC